MQYFQNAFSELMLFFFFFLEIILDFELSNYEVFLAKTLKNEMYV